jgi:hypothetical protein
VIEDDLRATLTARVAAPPHTPGLAETVLRRGRAARRRRRVASAAAVLVTVAAAGTTLAAVLDRDVPEASVATPDLSVPPRVPLFTAQEPATLTTWRGDRQRDRRLELLTPVAARADGSVLVTLAGNRPGLGLLGAEAGALRPLAQDLDASAVAVDAAGERAVVVAGRGGERRLEEREVATGRVLRVVPLGLPLVGAAEPVLPVAYSGDDVLLTLGEGDVIVKLGFSQEDGNFFTIIVAEYSPTLSVKVREPDELN